MTQSIKRILFIALLTSILLVACAPAQAATPDPALVADMVGTSVELTVASQNLDTAEAAPLATDTPVPSPTLVMVDTPTPILPTATPFVIVPPTTVSGGGGGVAPTSTGYSCDVIHQRPFDYSVYKPGDKFDIKWTILNTGTKTMRDGLDLKYNQGPKLTSVTRIELPELAPDDQYALELDGTAPDKVGNYIMTFIVEGGLCYPYVAITVEKP